MNSAASAIRGLYDVPVSRGYIRAAIVLLATSASLLTSEPALAHDPILLTSDQTTPENGPLFPDGTVSFAIYGTIEFANDTRGLRVRFAEGDELVMQMLIPDLEPERSLANDQLPILVLKAPDGTERTVVPGVRSTFAEPFSNTNYAQYISLREPAQAGEYRVTISGASASRFSLALGTHERFGTPVENVSNRDLGIAGVRRWYATPPPQALTAPPPQAPATTAVTIHEITQASAAATINVADELPSAGVPSSSSAAPVQQVSAPAPLLAQPSEFAPTARLVAIAAVVGCALSFVFVLRRHRRGSPR